MPPAQARQAEAQPAPRPPLPSAPMELALLAIWCFLVALGGGLVGLVLGNLRLPVVLLVASSPAAGAGANIAISAVAAGTASIAHIRAGRINWRLFAWMTPPSIVGAVAGGLLGGSMPETVLLACIAGVLLFSAWDLLRDVARRSELERTGGRKRSPDVDIRAAIISGGIIGV